MSEEFFSGRPARRTAVRRYTYGEPGDVTIGGTVEHLLRERALEGVQGPTWNDTAPPAMRWPRPAVSVMADGRTRLQAFDQFVIKLHSRCNLACDYCYIYELKDTGWRDRPRTMPKAVRACAVRRIADHVRQHRLTHVRVVLHGGEPLLAGREVIAELTDSVRRAVTTAGAQVEVILQTNGVLLDEPALDLLLRHDIRVGVSLDGDEQTHNRHRHGRAGRRRTDTHAQVTASLARLNSPHYRHLFAGLLCVVDPGASDPAETFDALVAHGPPAIDFLLPHGTWDHPAPGAGTGAAPFGVWLRGAFDRWRQTGGGPRIRLFESITNLCRHGTDSSSELVGPLPAAAVVIESDGAITWTGALNAVAEGAGHAGGTIFSHSFDAVLSLPGAPEHGMASLCRTCRECPLVAVCGAGFRAHRHGRGRGFANPSVYCADLSLLIRHIQDRLGEET